ncbi:MAG: hypothetical protein ABJG42_10805 [Vibrio splendidus]
MNTKPYSVWFLICTSVVLLIAFGTLIGMNLRISSNSHDLLSSDWATGILSSLVGAVIGAVLGSYGTYKTSTAIQDSNIDKLKDAYYAEIEHILTYLLGYLSGVAQDYRKYLIDISKNDSFCGPMEINFNTLQALEIELIKQRTVLTREQRKISHNLPVIVNSIFKEDEHRVVKQNDQFYRVQGGVSLDIMNRLTLLIYTLNRCVTDQDSYQFSLDENNLTLAKLQTVFDLTSLDQSRSVYERKCNW